MADLRTRTLTDADSDEFSAVFGAAFLRDDEQDLTAYRSAFRHAQLIGTFDEAEMIGVAGHFDQTLTVPGGLGCPLAAVTAVGVKPGHRRRGAASALMRHQLDDRRAAGIPLAALHASEGAIYGRYGYGVACASNHVEVPRGAAFRPGVEVDERPVREVSREQALPVLHEQYARIAPHRIGWLARGASWEAHELLEEQRGNDRRHRFALHPQGHLIYRAHSRWNDRGPDYRLEVVTLAAETPQAYAALWRYLLDLDLATEVVWPRAAADEPIAHLLADPRAARQRHSDGLWLRLVEVETALPARRYSAEADVVLELTDRFCTWNAGRWRLRTAQSGASVARTDEPAQLALDVTDLASAYLGGIALTSLAAAGRVRELAPGALASTSRAFTTERPPSCPDSF